MSEGWPPGVSPGGGRCILRAMRSLAFPSDLRRAARPALAIAAASTLAACNLILGIGEGVPTGSGNAGGGSSSATGSTSSENTSTSTATGMGGATTSTSTATGTATSTSSASSSSSSGTGGGMPKCDGTDPVGPALKQAIWSRRTAGNGTEGVQATAIAGDGSVLVTGFYDGPDTTFSLQNLPWDMAVGDAASDQRNVFVAKFAPDGKFGWAQGYTGILDQTPLGMTLDFAGDAIVTGRFEGSMKLDASTTLAAQGLDVFVAKLGGADGKLVWGKRFGGVGDELGQQVDTDSQGNVIVAGMTNDVIDFGCQGGASIAGQGAFLIKLAAADGSCMWAQKYAVDTRFTNKDDTGYPVAVAVDRQTDDVYLAGGAAAPNFGQGPKMSYGGKDAFVLKVHGDGSYVDAEVFGALMDDGAEYAGGVAVDPCGNVILVGSFTHSMSFGATTLHAKVVNAMANDADDEDIFLVKLDSTLQKVAWATSFGDAGWQYGTAVAVDGHGNVTIGGYIQDTADSKGVDFGGGLKHGPGPDMSMSYSNDVYLARFSADGKHLWSDRFGTTSGQRARGVAADDGGHAMLVGDFYTDQGKLLDFKGASAALQSVYVDGFLVEFGP
jgi:predicted small secreted protein